MKTTLTRTFFLTAATCGLLVGCAHQSPPPSELAEARSIYGRASAGPAARYAPARLKLAKQALESAEMAYGASPDGEVQDRAYVAIRRAQAAEAEASTIAANERRAAALRELSTLTGAHANRARAELAGANQKATEAGQRADLAQAQVAAEQGRTQEAQQQAQQQGLRAQETEAKLETEKKGRAEAEARAQQAMTEVARLAQVRQEARGVVITLSGQVLFVTNQAQLLPAAQASLDGVATALKQAAPDAGRVTIEGHSDSTGQRSYNLDLSRRRAEAVRAYLVDRGVRSELFAVQGVGPDRPVANNKTAEGRANNRRVEIIIPSAALALDKVKFAPGPGDSGLTSASSTTQTERSAGAGINPPPPVAEDWPRPAPAPASPAAVPAVPTPASPTRATSSPQADPAKVTPQTPATPPTTPAVPPSRSGDLSPTQLQPPPVTEPAPPAPTR